MTKVKVEGLNKSTSLTGDVSFMNANITWF